MEKEENSGEWSLETSPTADKNIKASRKKKVNEAKDGPKGSGEQETAANELENEEEEMDMNGVKSIASPDTSKANDDKGNSSRKAKAKKVAKLVKSKLLKRGSKQACGRGQGKPIQHHNRAIGFWEGQTYD